eukprot:6209052-Pleurochrysis_carterae.AAC.1
MVGGCHILLRCHVRRHRARCEKKARDARSRAKGLVTQTSDVRRRLLPSLTMFRLYIVRFPGKAGGADDDLGGGGFGGLAVDPSPRRSPS